MVDLQVGVDTVRLALEADPSGCLRCSGCPRSDLPVHEYCRRRDPYLLGKKVWLQVVLRGNEIARAVPAPHPTFGRRRGEGPIVEGRIVRNL